MKKKPLCAAGIVLAAICAFAGEKPDPASPSPAAFMPAGAHWAPGSAFTQPLKKRRGIGTMILGGVLGNLVGSSAGIYAGGRVFDEHDLLPFIAWWAGGSTLGSAAGVILAGDTNGWKGKPGMAAIGSALGVGLSWVLASSPSFQASMGPLLLVPLLVLPPVNAAIFYHASMEPRQHRSGNALFNLAGGRIGLGIPGFQLRPLSVPGIDARPELQFKVKVLSVEL